MRPDLTTSSNSSAFASSAAPSRSSAGSSSLTISSSAARCTADGKTSFDDWPMLTSSFACTSSPASVAITSFAFMFDEVPEPVWKTSIGNWSSSSPAAIRSAAAAIRSALSRVEQPELGVHARGGGLDAAEPARDGRRDRLARDREVLDRLARSRRPRARCAVSTTVDASWPLLDGRPAGPRSSSSHVASLTRGRPCGSPAARSAASIASQPAYSTKSHAALVEQRFETRPPALAREQRPARASSSRQLDRLGRVLLVRADHAARAALDPAGGVDAAHARRLVEHAAAVVRDHAARLVERHAGERRRRGSRRCGGRSRTGSTSVSSVGTARIRPSRPRRARCARPRSPRRAPRRGSRPARRGSAARARRGLPVRRAGGVLAQEVDVALRARAVGLERRAARRVELEVGRVDDDVGAGELAELLQLRRRERGLHRAAAAEHHDLPDARSRRSPSIAGVGRVGRRELLGGEREHPGDVDRDVAVPDHDRPLVREVELEVLEVGVAVVPGDERGRGPRARQVLARDPEPPVGLRADRVDDRVVAARASSSCVTSRPTSTLPKKRKPGRAAVRSNAFETALMFGWSGATPSRTSPHGVGSRSIRSTSTGRVVALQERVGGVEPGRPGADDGDAERRRSRQSRSSAEPQPAAASARFAVVDLEAVAAAARAGGVRVLDLEPGLLERLDEVDRRALAGTERSTGRRRRVTPWYSSSWSPAAAPRSKPSAYSKPPQPPPRIATRSTSAAPAGSCAISAVTLSAARSVSVTHGRPARRSVR